MSTRDFLSRLSGVTGGSGQWTARCPGHDDVRSSLSIKQGIGDEPVVHCHAGCDWREVFAAVSYERPRKPTQALGGFSVSRRETAVYKYEAADGTNLYEVVRYEPKDFRVRQLRPDGSYDWKLSGVSRVPFRLPAVIAASQKGQRVHVVEGEKDVLSLEKRGLTATTNAGGADKWEDGWASYFAGADVVILPDNDEPGRKHGERVARSLQGTARAVRIVALPGLPPKGDVSDWLGAGGSVEQLASIAEQASVWRSAVSPKAPRLRYFTLRELVSRPELLAEPNPVVPPFLYRGRITLLAGREKMGKSTLAAHAASALSVGSQFLGSSLTTGRILWYSLDEGLSDTVRRFQALGAALDNVQVCPDRPTATEVAEKLATLQPDLVVFDTLNELLPGMDLNRGEQTAPALRPYVDALRAANVAGCILCHASKGRGEYLGDVRIGGVVDAVLTLKEPRENVSTEPGKAPSPPAETEEDGPRLLAGKSRWGGKLHVRLTSTDGLRYELGEAPLSLDIRLLRALQEADYSSNELQSRLGGNRARVLEGVRLLCQRGHIEKLKQRLRITPAGITQLAIGGQVVPAGGESHDGGTTFADNPPVQLSAINEDGTGSALPGTGAEPAATKWFPILHGGVSGLEPPENVDDFGDAGPIGDAA